MALEDGLRAFKAGDYEKTIDELKPYIERSEKDHAIWNILGLAYSKTGQYIDADFCFSNALSQAPEIEEYQKNRDKNRVKCKEDDIFTINVEEKEDKTDKSPTLLKYLSCKLPKPIQRPWWQYLIVLLILLLLIFILAISLETLQNNASKTISKADVYKTGYDDDDALIAMIRSNMAELEPLFSEETDASSRSDIQTIKSLSKEIVEKTDIMIGDVNALRVTPKYIRIKERHLEALYNIRYGYRMKYSAYDLYGDRSID